MNRFAIKLFGAAVAVAVVFVLLVAGGSPQPDARADARGAASEDPQVAKQFAASTDPTSNFAPDQLMVRFERGTAVAARKTLIDRLDARVSKTIPGTGIQLLQLPNDSDVKAAVRSIVASDAVDFAEPNYLRQSTALSPNDPLLNDQWGLHNSGQVFNGIHDNGLESQISGLDDADIDAPEAWDITAGSPSITVAVVDTGVDYLHEDLSSRMWRNAGEIGTDGAGNPKQSNGSDDDSNGFVDDWRGYDTVGPNFQLPAPDADPMDDNYHGTHVAGTIGAAGNNGTGIAGVNWHSKVMPVKGLDRTGNGTSFQTASALAYAADNGARVVNGSYGAAAPSLTEAAVIDAHPRTLFVFAAGNAKADSDQTPFYPCAYPTTNIICVGSSNFNDELSSFSNWGRQTVDLFAPGSSIWSAKASVRQTEGETYWPLKGTSMASPHVAGAASLLLSEVPSATLSDVKAALIDGADRNPYLEDRSVSNGRLNLKNSLALVGAGGPAAKVSSTGGHLTFTAANGVADQVSVSLVAGALRVQNSTAVTPGAGCVALTTSSVSCPTTGLSDLRAYLRDKNDTFSVAQTITLPARIVGGDGNDTLGGGAGPDNLNGGLGSDVLQGGAASDTADYSGRSEALSISLDGNGAANDGAASLLEADSVRSDVENVVGGTGVDVISGDATANRLSGGDGADSLIGADGADILDGGFGADVFDGGSGVDVATYSERGGALLLSLDGAANDGAAGEGDSLSASVENVVGGSGPDQIRGDAGSNRLEGGGGNDTLGGGLGSDVFSGGSGTDTADFADRTNAVSLSQDELANDGDIATNESDNLSADIETLHGGSGDDTLSGGAADNTLRGFGGSDELNGGGGQDTLSYTTRSAALNISLDDVANDGDPLIGETDNAHSDVETIDSGSGNDHLVGSGANNTLIGNSGNDVLDGRGGDDWIPSGPGVPGSGADDVSGGLGLDTISYEKRNGQLAISLDDVANDGYVSGELDNVRSDVENVIGGYFRDSITGSDASNYLSGGGDDGGATAEGDVIQGLGGNDAIIGDGFAGQIGGCWYTSVGYDVISGGEGDDLIAGGMGEDRIHGDAGDDTLIPGDTEILPGCSGDDPYRADELHGGAGTDTVDLSRGTWHQTAAISGELGDPAGDVLHLDVEGIIGSLYADVLTGSTGDDILDGGDGPDTLDGLEGADDITGGGDNDAVAGGAGADYLRVRGEGTDTVDCGDDTDLDTVDPDSWDEVSPNCELRPTYSSTVGVVGGVMLFQAEAGKRQSLLIEPSEDGDVTIYDRDGGAVEPLTGCERFGGAKVKCASAGIMSIQLEMGDQNDDLWIDDGISLNALVNLGDGSDWARSGSGNDTLNGGDGPDSLEAAAGDDSIDGGDGDDRDLIGGPGADSLTGGPGEDGFNYYDAAAGAKVTLDDVANDGTAGEGDNIHSDIEVGSGSEHDDEFTGSAGNNQFDGSAGDDVINGMAGDDLLRGNDGDDTMQGGLGNDTIEDDEAGDNAISFAGSAAAVNVNLASGASANTGGNGNDTWVGINGLIGSNFNDVLTGDSLDNTIEGRGGNDTINGQSGSDTMSFASASSSVTFNVSTTTAQTTGGAGKDTASMMENILGTGFNDTLTGSSSANVIEGGAGNDTINALAGVDEVSYSRASAGVKVSLASTSQQNTLGAGRDSISNSERLTGSAFDDTLTGNSSSNTIAGLAGDDAIAGGSGSDIADYSEAPAEVFLKLGVVGPQDTWAAGVDDMTSIEGLIGSNHNDSIIPSVGSNVIDGRDGIDSIDYSGSSGGLTLSLASTAAQSTGGSGVDTVLNMENLTGSSFNDTLTGTPDSNFIDGREGADTISYANATAPVTVELGLDDGQETGGGGYDYLPSIENFTGSSHSDRVLASEGRNVIDGAGGIDTVDYMTAPAGVKLNLATTTSQNTLGSNYDTVKNTENLNGSPFNDTLTGNSVANTIRGGEGDDIVNGAGGTDTIDYSAAPFGVVVDLSSTTAQWTNGEGSDTLSNFENLVGSRFSDQLAGNSLANVIFGGNGSDSIFAGSGNDTIQVRDQTSDGLTECGSGTDVVAADRAEIGDPTDAACETVGRT